ncbi:DUF4142 domain-containing protein [Variovorax saccharolyticus]|uniref:DUF4142 domain-containing protein n=1 Tax=Variovorax saccharolyticus TaxID=3053516 RepID=UPI002574C1C6|nr:DUF4142 domain-containing protein [Variovorax sp. J31P216]MDM0030374.1 DUF4142 domain-containing protein [Variovorax sp. J31P216]
MKHLTLHGWAAYTAAFTVLAGALTLAPAAQAADDLHDAKPSRNITAPEARNDNPEGEGMAKSAPMALGKADRAFVTKAATGGLFEVEASRLAASRAADPRVKALAARLVRDHAEAHDALHRVALAHNYPLPDQLSEDQRALVAQLAGLQGKAFDSAFRQRVGIDAHVASIKLFERGSRSTRVPDLKAWIAATLPKMREHLKQARALTSA